MCVCSISPIQIGRAIFIDVQFELNILHLENRYSNSYFLNLSSFICLIILLQYFFLIQWLPLRHISHNHYPTMLCL